MHWPRVRCVFLFDLICRLKFSVLGCRLVERSGKQLYTVRGSNWNERRESEPHTIVSAKVYMDFMM